MWWDSVSCHGRPTNGGLRILAPMQLPAAEGQQTAGGGAQYLAAERPRTISGGEQFNAMAGQRMACGRTQCPATECKRT
eukprot:9242-Pyramimonas_sp.AAC.1